MSRYKDKTVIVTGSSSGMGLAASTRLKADGAHVIGLDIRKPDDAGGIEFIEVDLSDRSSLEDAVNAVTVPVNALFNCAGISGSNPKPMVMAINFFAMRTLTESVALKMGEGAAVVSVASVAASNWVNNREVLSELIQIDDWSQAQGWCDARPELTEPSAYALSKECVILYSMTKVAPLVERGIRINCISPGVTQTPFLEASLRTVSMDVLMENAWPSSRFGTPEEMANVMTFLNSAEASYVTGALVPVDGGHLAASGLTA
jgi:NAD(P)-dependent dehydrogenase (short-subunit alcohol dehydrogenase family)